MSRAAKSILVFLLLLLFVSVGLLTYITLQKQESDKSKISLEKQVDDFQQREKKYILENKDLQEKLKDVEKKKAELEERLSSFDGDVESLNKQISELTSERNVLQEKIAALEKERTTLLSKTKEKSEPQIVYKYVDRETGAPVEPPGTGAPVSPVADNKPELPSSGQKISANNTPDVPPDNETYWAQVIREKTSLELEVNALKQKLDANMLELEALKKSNSDLELEISELVTTKDSIEREIKHGKDLADNLSLALARAENDKEFLNGRFAKLNEENMDLRSQIKDLSSTKVALEKSIVRLQDEKKDVERKLMETEHVIQNRIDEIWQIKDSLEKNFQMSGASSKAVELPPIVVSSVGEKSGGAPEVVLPAPGFDGNIVSVNDENNFVIVDLGQNDGLKLGDNMSVYRGAEYVAALEVIQVRKDIAAADIKNKVTSIRVGDAVR
ncbi:MAG TPA: hypothetical protein PLT76_03520 [Candidatus Omnitrophota bacterium]|nr:hypothetical protein [Candidatus Omnitrophota bacterium]HQO57771.1 hypothetical protein [Candidatus Omnitrophota bacterium]HQP11271.1 hypothetical protein [Candidatus Omnitrophota bacterium]